MSSALLRCERGAITIGYDLRVAALGLATLAVAGVLQLCPQATVAKVRTHLAHQEAARYLFAASDRVNLPTGERVPLGRDGRTKHGFLPEDAWKEVRFDRARRAALERNGGSRAPRGRKDRERD